MLEPLHGGMKNQETFFPNDCKDPGTQKLHKRVINADETAFDPCIHGAHHSAPFTWAMFVARNKQFSKCACGSIIRFLWIKLTFVLFAFIWFGQGGMDCFFPLGHPPKQCGLTAVAVNSVSESSGFAGQTIWGDLKHLPIPSVWVWVYISHSIKWTIMRSHVANLDVCFREEHF